MGIQRDIKFDDQTEIGAPLLGRIVLRVGIDPERRDGSVAGETGCASLANWSDRISTGVTIGK